LSAHDSQEQAAEQNSLDNSEEHIIKYVLYNFVIVNINILIIQTLCVLRSFVAFRC
jgi:hypothetical protein